MEKFPCWLACLWLVGCLLAGCQSPPPAHALNPIVLPDVRNNCYSLLHQLLDEEKDLNKLHFIKQENSGLKDFLKRISVAAAAGEKQLDLFAKADASLVLTNYYLPRGEQKTRDDISAAQEKELLHESGSKLEMTLLLSQVEALNYASHLAKVAGENDFQPERARFLADLSSQMLVFHDDAVSRLDLRK